MLGFSIVLSIIGLIGTIYGMSLRSSAEYALASAFGVKEIGQVDMLFYLGVIALVVGVIMLIVAINKKK